MDSDVEKKESWWESTKHFEVIPGETFGTQPWFVGLSIVVYLATLYFLTKWMENRPAYKLNKITALHKFFFRCYLL